MDMLRCASELGMHGYRTPAVLPENPEPLFDHERRIIDDIRSWRDDTTIMRNCATVALIHIEVTRSPRSSGFWRMALAETGLA